MRASTVSWLLPVLAVRVHAEGNATGTAENPVTGSLGNATVVEINPPGVVYTAVLPATAWTKALYPAGGNVVGEVMAVASASGIGVTFKIKFSNLPKDATLGPFSYHLHAAPVPADGNCTKTLAHLDPFVRGEVPPCNATMPQTCQVGDLAGKYGKITTDPFEASYTDLFASTMEGMGSFFGNRSIVLHTNNKTRITCANFVVAKAGGASTATTKLNTSNCDATSSTCATRARSTNSPSNTSGSSRSSGTATVGNSATTERVAGWAWMLVLVGVMMFAL